MAPWAHTGKRVDDVKAAFHIFPLGKLLWVMVSGQPIPPPYYTHRSDGFDLERMFPGEPCMEQTNSILDKCVVTDENRCFVTAKPLLEAVEHALKTMRSLAQQLRAAPLNPSLNPDFHFLNELSI